MAVYYLLTALKIGMLIDAYHRNVAFYWFFVILAFPFGEVLYFAFLLAPDLLHKARARRARRPLSVEQLRYRFKENPCQENEAALAAGLCDVGETAAARELYVRVLDREPDYKRALYGLALCHLRLGEPELATERLERVVSLERSYADHRAWLKLGEALRAAGRHPEAVDTFERLVRAAPRIEHQVALAQAQRAAGRAEQALRTLEAGLEEYRHAPRFIRREAREPARLASKILAELKAA